MFKTDLEWNDASQQSSLSHQESKYQDICLSHDFVKTPIGKVFPRDCNEPIIGALIDSEEDYNNLLTNIWQFKIAPLSLQPNPTQRGWANSS